MLSRLAFLALISFVGCSSNPTTNNPDAGSGSDGASSCGNGVVDPGETCDGNCPTSCAAPDSCTSAALTGQGCNVQCTYAPIVGPTCNPPYYVSKNGDNSDGRSWATAWNEMDQIKWAVIKPGDRIFLDGDTKEMVYTTPLTVGASGTSVAPIAIKLSREAGHDGTAVIFGGVTEPPYDDQPTYDGTMPTMDAGIDVGGHAWIVIDGTKWGGIAIHGTGYDGVTLGAHSNNAADAADQIVLRNIKIYDIGTPEQVTSTVTQNKDYATFTIGHWHTKANATGIYFNYQVGASNVTMERMIISNTSDEGIGEGPCKNLVLRQSWLDNGRTMPSGDPWNYHNHPDGIQNYGWGGAQGPWLIEDTVIGPRFMQGLFPGVTSVTNVDAVTVKNVLLLDNISSNILAESASNWTFDHVTSYMSGNYDALGSWNNFSLGSNPGFTFTSSIFYGKGMSSTAPVTFTSNVYWNTSGTPAGFSSSQNTHADPLFVDPANYDLSLQSGSPAAGLGSEITSVASLFAKFPDGT